VNPAARSVVNAGSLPVVPTNDPPAHPSWAGERIAAILHPLTSTLLGDPDLGGVVSVILETARSAVHADRGILFLGRGDEAGLVPVQAVRIDHEELAGLGRLSRALLARGVPGQVLITGDVLRDLGVVDLPPVEMNKIRTSICVPLQAPSGRVGAIYLDAGRPDAFASEAESTLGLLAEVAAAILENQRVLGNLAQENLRLRRTQSSAEAFGRIIGTSQSIDLVRRRAAVLAELESPLLLHGPRGSGRELLARAIHEAGRRAIQPFLVVDCGAVNEANLQDVLWGRTGVAAAGPRGSETGYFQRARLGTVVLREVQGLGADLSARLARNLEEGVFRPTGGRQDFRMESRLILTTSLSLSDLVKRGKFCADLYRRASEVTLTIPPLRERACDIPDLVRHFLDMHSVQRHRFAVTDVSEEALRLLQAQSWPGNVRELELIILRAVISATRPILEAEDLRAAFVPPPEETVRRLGPWSGRVLPLEEWEREAIAQALAQTKGNKSKAARLLGVHRNTLVRKVQELQLQ